MEEVASCLLPCHPPCAYRLASEAHESAIRTRGQRNWVFLCVIICEIPDPT